LEARQLGRIHFWQRVEDNAFHLPANSAQSHFNYKAVRRRNRTPKALRAKFEKLTSST